MNLSGILILGFGVLFSLFSMVTSGTVQISRSNPKEDSECSLKCADFKTLETRNQELEKSQEELKRRFESSQEKCNEQFTSLSKNFEEFKSEIFEDHGLSFLTPPLRGPPGKQGPPVPWAVTSCSDALEILQSPLSKKQTIYPDGTNRRVDVLCDFETDGGGWTLIQKRSSGPKYEFDQNWNEYVKGFGSLNGNFWLGLDNIRALTKNEDQELRIELEDFEGEKRWVKYSNFSISDAWDSYRLSIGGFSGDAGNSMASSYYAQNHGMRFTTKDKDNGPWLGGNCAQEFPGGWWSPNRCGISFLNGIWREKGDNFSKWVGIIWYTWKGSEYSLAKTEMKIRKRR